MKHYHQREELLDSDVIYYIVEENADYQFRFIRVDSPIDSGVIQGVKFWLNRCSMIIDAKLVSENTKVIFWYYPEAKKSKLTNGHLHYYFSDSIEFKIIQTIDEKPNLGTFNVWTYDKRRCYEFENKSWIKEAIEEQTTSFKAKHGGFKKEGENWIRDNLPTIEFSISKL